MSILSVQHLSHSFGNRIIFQDVSFRILKGEHIGLIGANGEGKSTFLQIVTQTLQPDEGTVEWAKNVRVGYLDQHTSLTPGSTLQDVLRSAFQPLFALETQLNDLYLQMTDASPALLDRLLEEVGQIQETLDAHDFYLIDTKVDEIANGLGLRAIGLHRDVTELSGGQRTKLLLAKLLLEKPDILLLDEPTNYLDAPHIEWLQRYLLGYDNAFVLISHDMPFLNSVIGLIYHVENAQLTRYVGNYDDFLRVYEEQKQQKVAAYKRQQQEISQLQDFVARNKARVSTRNMAMSRQKRLDKMDVLELAKDKPKPSFHFVEAKTPSKVIFSLDKLVIGYDTPLSQPLTLSLLRGQKVALIGANGIGKTTLLRSLLGLNPPLLGTVETGDGLEIGYFEQEVKASPDLTCIDAMWNEYPHLAQRDVRAALAKCGLTTQHIESKMVVLSGGEQAKVRLCTLQNRATNVLILDEPTNHLDVEAIAFLASHLRSRTAAGLAMLVVSHDRWFLDAVCTRIWEVHDGVVDAYDGGYAAYVLARVERQRQAAATEARRKNL
ncbi:MAG: ABC-F family ATP-binding cassette domain-containing protein, partial [Alicyclobacillaceae bacterium]|nr:ABC-F family ATP-binding cassette domain-containing protein [Alicyclobacillaceae bacterium]